MDRPISIPVKAVLRGRPLIQKEHDEGCQTCLEFIPSANQVVLGENRAFTFDHVFGGEIGQEEVYKTAVEKLTQDIFKGYHAAVIAYGQTGSGKTYSMGSAHSMSESDDESIGVIPRVISDIFGRISTDSDRSYTVKVSYLELYKKELHDLLCMGSEAPQLTIRDAPDGGTLVNGLSEILVSCASSTLALMEQGNNRRTTAATAMNKVSSRSHAIFTIILESVSVHDSNDKMSSKFHLVDLAGSERVKRTKAEGERLQEGIKINEGLLALGNVISALADENTRSGHIKYRDSKLTRILQGSLGGNSHTLMIACVSPADSNFEETLNTLRYADRVRKIKNAPVVNRDPQAMLIASLKKEVLELNLRLLENQGGSSLTNRISPHSGSNNNLFDEIEKLKVENCSLSDHLQQALAHQADMCEKVILTEMCRDRYKEKLLKILHSAKNLTEKFPELKTENKDFDDTTIKNVMLEISQFCKEAVEIQIEDDPSSSDSVLMEPDYPNGANVELSQNITKEDATACEKALAAKHVMKNAHLGKQLQDLTKALALKEEIAKTYSSNDSQMKLIKDEYEKKMQQLDKDIQHLTSEKATLENALESARKTNESKKLSEKRRQRVRELESQIQDLRKEKVEKEKLLRVKAEKERNIERLNKEIISMKQSRVNLMKQIRAENEKFNTLKREKARELKQLQEKNRKRHVEYIKLERTYDKQKAILRRKTEEAAAANKRLKETLNKQAAAASKRRLNERRFNEKVGPKVTNWLEEEVELSMSIWEAEHHLNMLLEDRKMLTRELQKNTDPPQKRRRTYDSTDKQAMDDKKKELQQEMRLKNGQIQAIQTKLTEAKERHTGNLRWSTIGSFAEAKSALKQALHRIIDEKVKLLKMEEQMKEMEAEKNQFKTELGDAKQELQQLSNKYDEEKTVMERSHQEEMSYYLDKLGSTTNRGSKNDLLNMISEQNEVIANLEEEKKILHKRLFNKEINTPLKRRFFNPVANADSFQDIISPNDRV